MSRVYKAVKNVLSYHKFVIIMVRTMSRSRRNSVIFACLAIAAIYSGVHGKPPSRVAGGQYVKPGEVKYMVGVMESGSHICGGAIISKRHILTAGHCVENPRNLSVIGGIVDINDPTRTVHKVSKVILHPDYVPYTPTSNVERDIALIVLEEELNLGDRLSTVGLPRYQIEPGFSAMITGWGYTSPQNTESPHLMKLHVTFLNEKNCLDKVGWFTEDRLCGYHTSGTICGGDSGSPLVTGSMIVGIASTSNCIIGEAHVYTNVYYYLKWIIDSMRKT